MTPTLVDMNPLAFTAGYLDETGIALTDRALVSDRLAMREHDSAVFRSDIDVVLGVDPLLESVGLDLDAALGVDVVFVCQVSRSEFQPLGVAVTSTSAHASRFQSSLTSSIEFSPVIIPDSQRASHPVLVQYPSSASARTRPTS